MQRECSCTGVCLVSEDSHLGRPQRKKLLERAEPGIPGTIIVGQVQFCPPPWQQRGHENHVAIIWPLCPQIHQTGLGRPVDDQGRPGIVQILLVEIALLISEDFSASLEQQPFRLWLNRLDHIPVRPLCDLEHVRFNLYTSDCSAHRLSSPFRRDCSDGMCVTETKGSHVGQRLSSQERASAGDFACSLALGWPLRSNSCSSEAYQLPVSSIRATYASPHCLLLLLAT